VLVADFASFALVLSAGILYLFLLHDLKIYEIAAAIILVVLTVGLTALLAWVCGPPSACAGCLAWLQGAVNRLGAMIKRPSLLPEKLGSKKTLRSSLRQPWPFLPIQGGSDGRYWSLWQPT